MNTTQLKRFKGLNNVSDPLRLKFGWLQTADNLNITDTGALERRDGYSKEFDGAISGAYTTADYKRFYIVDGGTLKAVNKDMTMTELKTGLSSQPVHWTEINEQVFYTNGLDSGIITKGGAVLDWSWAIPEPTTLVAITGALPAGTYQVACTYVLPDGRETGSADAATIYLDGAHALQINDIPHVAGYLTQVYIAPADSTVFQLAYADFAGGSATWNGSVDQLGVDLVTHTFDPIPLGCTHIAAWRGQMYAAQYFTDSDQTALWISEPLGFHLFNLNASFIVVPGRVALLAPHADGLVIGTESRIYVYDGEGIKEVADYGVVPGYGWAADEDDSKQILFWTQRGVCTALPFSNITSGHISVDCGLSAGAAIIRKNGAKRFVVALRRGGDNFNQRGQ
jgi:hypothetical protein